MICFFFFWKECVALIEKLIRISWSFAREIKLHGDTLIILSAFSFISNPPWFLKWDIPPVNLVLMLNQLQPIPVMIMRSLAHEQSSYISWRVGFAGGLAWTPKVVVLLFHDERITQLTSAFPLLINHAIEAGVTVGSAFACEIIKARYTSYLTN